MSYKKLFIFFFVLLLIGGCSKNTNKANIDEKIFSEGEQIVKLYAKAYNGDDDAGEKADDLAKSFLKKYDEDTYSFSSTKDKLFVRNIKLLQLKYDTYSIQTVSDMFSGDSDSDATKEEVKNLLLQIKDEYGISLDE